MGGRPFERIVPVELPASAQREGIRSLWARTKVGELMIEGYEKHRDAITELGLQYSLMTPFTSFVAIEHQTISEAGKLRTMEVPEGADGRMAGAESVNFAMHRTTAAAPTGFGSGVAGRQAPQVYPEERKEKDSLVLPAPRKLSAELRAKTNSQDKIGVRLYVRDVTDATLNKLRAAGLHILAQPGAAKLIIGEIAGAHLLALAALEEVYLIAAR